MSETQIKITYKPLWKMLRDREMSKTDLRKKMDVLARICVELNCGFDDIVQIESVKKNS